MILYICLLKITLLLFLCLAVTDSILILQKITNIPHNPYSFQKKHDKQYTTMDNTSQQETPEISLFRKFLCLIGLDKSPDTAEDLEQEIQELLEDGEEQGLISSQEGMMINSIFEFKDTMVKEIMTPKTEIICAQETLEIQELINIIIDKGFTRIPIYSETPDHIIGILHAKDLLFQQNDQTSPRTTEIISPALFVLENHKIGKLRRDFKTQKKHLAIVTDEFGSVRGLVTLEDILEEIVGEIVDEYDKENILWRVIDEKTVQIDAKIDREEVEMFFQTSLPEGPYESIGGLVIHQLGRLPQNGETVKIDGLKIKVLAASQRRITTLEIRKTASVQHASSS